MSTITALSGEPINNNGGATRNTFLTIGSVDNRNIFKVPAQELFNIIIIKTSFSKEF